MEAKARSFSFISNESIVKIPFFQRGYVWKKDNWADLLSDLQEVNKNHFLGSIILKQQHAPAGDPKEVLVIDGQQRLTTISILIKALFDSFSDETKGGARDVIRQHLFYKKNRTDKNYLVKIHHSHVDAKSYNSVIKFGLDSVEPVPTSEIDRILLCYHFYINAFKNFSEEAKDQLFNYLLDPENKIIVVIDLHQEDDEQAIFDTINSAGVRLTPSDIIKNSLFQSAISFVGITEAVALYSETWDDVFVKNNLKFWELQRATGRLMRDNLEILLHSIAVIKGFYDPEKHNLADLSKQYKTEISSFTSYDELKSFVSEIKDYATIYLEKVLVFNSSTLFSFENQEQRLFHLLQVLEVSTFHPFILSLYKLYEPNQIELKRLLELLEKFVVRRFISGFETKSFNKLAKEFINDHTALQKRTAEMTDEHLKSGLKYISNKHASLILFWVELRRRQDDPKIGLKDLKYDYTLEHIMPQKWEQYWPMPTKNNSDGTPIAKETLKAERFNKVYSIGNMTLLTSSLNTSLRNYEYKRKMEGEGRKKGIKAYADLYITKTDLVEKYDAGDNVWDEQKIEQRTTELINEVLKIW